MGRNGRFALVVVVATFLAVAATFGAISARDRASLPVSELLRLESVSVDDPRSVVEGNLYYAFEVLTGQRLFTDTDLAERFTPDWPVMVSADELNASLDELAASVGQARFVRLEEREPRRIVQDGPAIRELDEQHHSLLVAEDGTIGRSTVAIAADGRISTLLIDEHPATHRRLPDLESTMIVVTGLVLIAGAATSWRAGRSAQGWMLLAASVATLAGILIVSDTGVWYSVGRTGPSLVALFAVAVMVAHGGRWRRPVVVVAASAALVGVLAPFTRDPELIAHPPLVVSAIDDEVVYRVLLSLSAVLTAVALGGAVALNIGRIGAVRGWTRPALWAVPVVACIWAIAAAFSAVDYGFGDGTAASGPLEAIGWSALAAVPVAVSFRSGWNQMRRQLDEVEASRARIVDASDTALRRIERDLHDGAQQRLVGLGLQLQRARRLVGTNDGHELSELLDGASTEVRETIEEIRAVSRGRQPSLLAERGLVPAVDALAERAPVPVEIDITTDRLPPTTERAAYYMIAEGLTNVAKHAMATRARISISTDHDRALITVVDDGGGGAKIAEGSGLEGLSDRIAATGGSFTISSGPEGTALEAQIPYR